MVARTIHLRGTDGSTWDLINGPIQAGTNPQHWGSGSVQLSERTSAMLPGAKLTNRRHAATDLVVPLVILDPVDFATRSAPAVLLVDDNGVAVVDDDTGTALIDGLVTPFEPLSLEEIVAAFARSIDPVHGDVTLTVGRESGKQRQITCTYQAGFSGLSHRDHEFKWLESTVAFRAVDPFWRAVEDESVIVAPPPQVFTSGTTAFSDPLVGTNAAIPFNGFLIDDVLFSDPTVGFNEVVGFSGTGAGVRLFDVLNVGDVDAWPSFRVVGPASVVEVDNVSQGVSWRYDNLGAGQELTISTQPGSVQVRIDGVNAFGSLAGGLWPLPRATSTVAVRFDGATSASSFAMTWRPRYLTC